MGNLRENTDNKAIHELRDDLKDLIATIKQSNKETRREGRIVTLLVTALALVQLTVGLGQLLFAFYENQTKWYSTAILVFMLMVVLALYFLFWRELRKVGEEK